MLLTIDKPEIAAEDVQMYHLEKMGNFRHEYRALATKSRVTFDPTEQINLAQKATLLDLGQFACLAYFAQFLPVSLVMAKERRAIMTSRYYPLEKFTAFHNCADFIDINGSVTNLTAFATYRPTESQLVVAIAGTTNSDQAFQQAKMIRCEPDPLTGESDLGLEKGTVHLGFWAIYKGIRNQLLDVVTKAIESTHSDLKEIAIVGHSMGGVMATFLAKDIMVCNLLRKIKMSKESNSRGQERTRPEESTPSQAKFNIVLATFGAPRCGDAKFVIAWQQIITLFRGELHDRFTEYGVKIFRDGVPCMPLYAMGYRNHHRNNYYEAHGMIFPIPNGEHEHACFTIQSDDQTGTEKHGLEEKNNLQDRVILHANGGHNYYNAIDLEKLVRRARLYKEVMAENLPDNKTMEIYEEKVRNLESV